MKYTDFKLLKVTDKNTFASAVEHNGPGSVEVNPWVWVIEFKRVQP